MFLHNFKYDLICTIREKSFIFWVLAFPIILATFFHLAFGSIYETDTLFNAVPAAIVETSENQPFKQTISQLTEGDDPMMKAEYTDEASALEKLENGDIEGIIYVGDEITLTVSHSGSSIQQTVLREFLDRYRATEAVITDTAMNNPEKLEEVISAVTEEINCNENIPLTNGDMDPYASFFYNLIAMAALFGSMTGLHVATGNQGNLSHIAARKCISPTNKLVSILSNLLASFIAQAFCVCVAITYIIFVLGENLGDKIPMIYLSGAVGSIAGITAGFFIGSVGRISEGAKIAIASSVSMLLCFLSGLMVGDMKMIVEEHAPIVNRISPAALISDMFYCLNVCNDYSRYIEKVISILIISALFTLGGFLMTRRKKYASL
ncbi:MAG: ABC transporter permease [Porcipelethomonas sp.]